jgi:hypothetical protein
MKMRKPRERIICKEHPEGLVGRSTVVVVAEAPAGIPASKGEEDIKLDPSSQRGNVQVVNKGMNSAIKANCAIEAVLAKVNGLTCSHNNGNLLKLARKPMSILDEHENWKSFPWFKTVGSVCNDFWLTLAKEAWEIAKTVVDLRIEDDGKKQKAHHRGHQ